MRIPDSTPTLSVIANEATELRSENYNATQCRQKLMYFPLLFQVIGGSCFRFTPATPTFVHSVLHGCPYWPVIRLSTYTLRCLLSTIHARGSIQFIHLSGLCSPIRVMPNDQKQSEGSSVPAEVGQTSSGDGGGKSAAGGQVFSLFKDFLEKN